MTRYLHSTAIEDLDDPVESVYEEETENFQPENTISPNKTRNESASKKSESWFSELLSEDNFLFLALLVISQLEFTKMTLDKIIGSSFLAKFGNNDYVSALIKAGGFFLLFVVCKKFVLPLV